MIISLMGFMGSGKSSIGRRMSAKMDIPLIDLDDYIIEKEGLSINEIFAVHGEDFFRLLETHYLSQVIYGHHDVIIALGGGTPCQMQNWSLINKTTSVYLKRKKSYLFENLKEKKDKRPLIKDLTDQQLKKLIKKKLAARTAFYEKANLIVNADGTKAELTNMIIKKLKKYNKRSS